MIDVTTSRTIALHTRLPPLIFGLSITVALLSGLLAGYDMAKRKRRSWIHVLLYAVVIALTSIPFWTSITRAPASSG
jgi:ABC-type dipeptide/oligopeptide/nickel transport system permease component